MVKFRGSKPECVKGNRLRQSIGSSKTADESSIYLEDSVHAHLAILTMKLTKPRPGLIVKGDICIDEFCPPERFEVLCSLIA